MYFDKLMPSLYVMWYKVTCDELTYVNLLNLIRYHNYVETKSVYVIQYILILSESTDLLTDNISFGNYRLGGIFKQK